MWKIGLIDAVLHRRWRGWPFGAGGPPRPSCRGRPQTTPSCCGQEPLVVSVVGKGAP